MESALEILDYLMTRDNLDLQVNHKSVGGTSYEEHGLPITDEALSLAKDSDAILFGAVGLRNGTLWNGIKGLSKHF